MATTPSAAIPATVIVKSFTPSTPPKAEPWINMVSLIWYPFPGWLRAIVNVPFTSVTSNDASLPPPTTFVAVKVVVAKFMVPNEPAVVTVAIGVIEETPSSSTILAENGWLVSLKLLKTISSPKSLFRMMRDLSLDKCAETFVSPET